MSKRKKVTEETTTTTSTSSSFINKIKFVKEKDRFMIWFPLVKDGALRVKTVIGFAPPYGKVLSDGKWHSFQMPESDEVYELCKKSPLLKEEKVRFALVLVYDNKKYKKGKDVTYHWAWLKMTDTKVEQVNEIIDELMDEGDDNLDDIDILLKLNAGKNALKMQDSIMIAKGKSIAKNNKCVDKYKTILKEAEEIWENLEDRVMNIEDDDTILAWLDGVEDDDDDNKGKSKKKKDKKKKKKKFSKKDLD